MLILITLALLQVKCTDRQVENKNSQAVSSDSSVKKNSAQVILYGIAADSFNITRGSIRPNRFLSGLLEEYGITAAETETLVRNSANVFDVRDMRAWHSYIALTDRDSAGRLKYLVYEHESSLFYIFSFNDSLKITQYRQETSSVIRFSLVTIETSLWEAMISQGINPEIAVELSDIYAWTVDFFGLQKGDRFSVIYEERYIGEKKMGTGRIFAACYFSGSDTIYAIPFIQDNKESYYDASGNSLRKTFLKAPLRFSRISSRFSSGRMHPILRIVRPHFGVDYAAPVGTPVYSIGDGRVISISDEGESGKMVKIRHNSVYTTAYLHLSNFAQGIAAGGFVKQGDVIGYVGSSGLSTGPHLDFRFYQNGYAVDPLRIEAPPVEPVKEENRARFEIISAVTMKLLGSVN
jgi:murein DD-endopeptidase MepM/ murein hydrolase activator NlpD